MRLHHLSVRHIMMPRPVMFTVAADMTVQAFFSQHSDKPFSRIPLYAAGNDDITEYVLKSDLLIAQAKDQFDRKLSEFGRPFLIIPDLLSASVAFDRLMHDKSHIALVVDEYGATQGLVTIEDVIETLIGLEITDELDSVEDMQALAQRRWRERMKRIGIDPNTV
jgi:CBS domain containing-hemolysin-like protein